MSSSLIYEGNGVYKAHLESGEIRVTQEELYAMTKDLAKIEKTPCFVDDFEYNECWIKSYPTVNSIIKDLSKRNDKEFNKLIELELEEMADKIIVTAQEVASDYYQRNFIMIDR